MNIFRKICLLFACMILSFVSICAESFPSLSKEVFKHDSIAAQQMKVIKDYRNIYDNHPRKDLNDEDCSLLRVITLNDSCISFGGNIVGDVEYKDLEYWVYMPGGSHLLQINVRDKILNLDLSCMNNEGSLKGGESYSLCGLDNDDYVSLNYYIELIQPEDMKKLRGFAHEYIETFNYRNIEKFRGYYNHDVRLIKGNGDALNRMLSELEENESLGYYAKCFPIDQHPAKQHVYCMTVGFYNSDLETIGYSLLLLDLNEPGTIQNHISTYQTEADVRRDGIFTFVDFFVP